MGEVGGGSRTVELDAGDCHDGGRGAVDDEQDA